MKRVVTAALRVNSLWVIAAALTIAMPTIASAHVLKTDGDTSVELHIKPDDKPVAGVPVNYLLSFEKTAQGFSLQNCNCSISFIKYGATVATRPLAATTATESDDTFTFPDGGAYTFHVTGSPKAGATFASFAVDYPVQVGAAASQPISICLWIGGAAVVIVLVILANTLGRRKKRTT